MALLACTRCYRQIGGAAKEPIDDGAKPEQIIQRSDEPGLLWGGCRSLEVRPLGRDERLAAVRQNEDKL
jgi:hypothetical protein